MAKNIIKEIIIMLLLCLAIILILGVILYEYVPSNKILPEEVSYVTPQNIKEELRKIELEEIKNKIGDRKNTDINKVIKEIKNEREAELQTR